MVWVFDGHVWNMKLLDPDVFTSFSLAAMTELPAAILLAIFLDRWGRRWMGFASMFMCGVFSFIALATPAGKLKIKLLKQIAHRSFSFVFFTCRDTLRKVKSLKHYFFGTRRITQITRECSRCNHRRHGDFGAPRCQRRRKYRFPILG